MGKLALITLVVFALAAGTWVFVYEPTKEQRCATERQNYPAIVQHGPRNVQKIALTFDAWGSRKQFTTILDILHKKDVRAVFFVYGKGIVEDPDMLRLVADEGHLLGNHTYWHKDLTKVDARRVRDEVRWTHSLFEKYGFEDKPYLRYPFGKHNDETDAIILKMGYSLFFWDVNSGGTGYPAEEVQRRILAWSEPGSIILMHISSDADIKALPHVIDGLRARGLEPVRLDELFPCK